MYVCEIDQKYLLFALWCRTLQHTTELVLIAWFTECSFSLFKIANLAIVLLATSGMGYSLRSSVIY